MSKLNEEQKKEIINNYNLYKLHELYNKHSYDYTQLCSCYKHEKERMYDVYGWKKNICSLHKVILSNDAGSYSLSLKDYIRIDWEFLKSISPQRYYGLATIFMSYQPADKHEWGIKLKKEILKNDYNMIQSFFIINAEDPFPKNFEMSQLVIEETLKVSKEIYPWMLALFNRLPKDLQEKMKQCKLKNYISEPIEIIFKIPKSRLEQDMKDILDCVKQIRLNQFGVKIINDEGTTMNESEFKICNKS